jgi:hypothetical protein
MAGIFFNVKWVGKQGCHLTILSVAKIWSMELIVYPRLGPRIRTREAMLIVPTYAFTANSLTIFSFPFFHEEGCGLCYFCFLPLTRSVDQTSVLLLMLSTVDQVCWSNICPVTSVSYCWPGLLIKHLSCYFCSLLLNKSEDETTYCYFCYFCFLLLNRSAN